MTTYQDSLDRPPPPAPNALGEPVVGSVRLSDLSRTLAPLEADAVIFDYTVPPGRNLLFLGFVLVHFIAEGSLTFGLQRQTFVFVRDDAGALALLTADGPFEVSFLDADTVRATMSNPDPTQLSVQCAPIISPFALTTLAL